MKIKKLKFGDEARKKIKEGIDLVADYTKITLGPKGRNVALNQFGPLPTRVVNDGVTIANEIRVEDPYVQSGVEMVQEICKKTNFNAGDGTTQTALLSQAIVEAGSKLLAADYNPVDIKNSLVADSDLLGKALDKMTKPIAGDIEAIKNIATISGNNDPEIGEAVSKIMKEVGMNASIVIEKGNEERIKTKAVKGMWFDKGYRVPAFVNNPYKMSAEYKNPIVLLVEDNIKWDDEIAPLFNKIEKAGLHKDGIVCIFNEIEGEALHTLAITNRDKMMGGEGMMICAIEAPLGGPDRHDFLSDVAVYTGAKVISKENGVDIQEVDPVEVIGSCDKFVSTSKTTTFIGGLGKKSLVKKRLQEIKGLIKQCGPTEKVTKEKLEGRRDTIESGVGIIYSGGNTEIEIKDRNLRLEDAVLAAKSAVKEGYVAGGGLTYLSLAKKAKTPILKKALQSVIKQIARNAGKSPDVIVDSCDDEIGYNAKSDRFENMIEAGVIDATLVVKNALKNSISLACMFLTTEAIIAETTEEAENIKPRIKK